MLISIFAPIAFATPLGTAFTGFAGHHTTLVSRVATFVITASLAEVKGVCLRVKRRIQAVVLLLCLATLASPPPRTPQMPLCQTDEPAPKSAPQAPPSLRSSNTCRARVTAIQRINATPAPGYHHLGATTATRWSGVLGRIEVADAQVRANTYDFVATRFMAKAQTREGLAWLEAGWTETGWSGGGRQRIYSYDTNRQSWVFYDEYRIQPGDRVWIFLRTEQEGERAAWQAWLWWGDKWNLLTSQELAIGGRALLEQYVEVHGDSAFQVPQIRVDSVALQDGPRSVPRYWDDTVPTGAGSATADYCLTWLSRYSSWSAGSCGLSSIQAAGGR